MIWKHINGFHSDHKFYAIEHFGPDCPAIEQPSLTLLSYILSGNTLGGIIFRVVVLEKRPGVGFYRTHDGPCSDDLLRVNLKKSAYSLLLQKNLSGSMPHPFPVAAIPVILSLLMLFQTIRADKYPGLAFLRLYAVHHRGFILTSSTGFCLHKLLNS